MSHPNRQVFVFDLKRNGPSAGTNWGRQGCDRVDFRFDEPSTRLIATCSWIFVEVLLFEPTDRVTWK